MKYYVTDCISGVYGEKEGIPAIATIEEARAIRDKWNAERKAEGGSDTFWIIVNGRGKEVK